MNPIQRRSEREQKIDPAYVASILSYHPESGEFFWKIDRALGTRAGGRAGGVTPLGYYSIRIDNQRHQAHRLAWAISHGKWPVFDIDHIDGNKLNNRLSNLREATRSQNRANSPLSTSNKSGVKGVFWNKARGKWQVQIAKKHFGLFSDFDEALAVSRRAADELFSSYARHP